MPVYSALMSALFLSVQHDATVPANKNKTGKGEEQKRRKGRRGNRHPFPKSSDKREEDRKRRLLTGSFFPVSLALSLSLLPPTSTSYHPFNFSCVVVICNISSQWNPLSAVKAHLSCFEFHFRRRSNSMFRSSFSIPSSRLLLLLFFTFPQEPVHLLQYLNHLDP